MARQSIATEAEFQELMERVDATLRAQDIPIYARPAHAESVLARELGEPFVHPYPRRDPVPGCYTGDDLTIRVERWFDIRYGDRLKTDLSPGSLVLLIRGDAWLVRYPYMSGSWQLICSATQASSPPGPHVRRAGQPAAPLYYNILDSIADFPPSLAAQLTLEECTTLVRSWHDGYLAWDRIAAVSRQSDLVQLAVADLHITVQQLSAKTGTYGLAKWHALQAVEKMLKAYLMSRAEPFAFTHKLDDLAQHAEDAGLSPIARPWLQLVQCAPGVRYGGISVGLADAVVAHQAGIGISAHIAGNFK